MLKVKSAMGKISMNTVSTPKKIASRSNNRIRFSSPKKDEPLFNLTELTVRNLS